MGVSAQAEKVLRRDLRRAVGAEAIGVIDHNAKLLAALQQRVSIHDNWLSELHGQRQLQERRLVWLETAETLGRNGCDAYLVFRHRTFWQRLRWLVTGK